MYLFGFFGAQALDGAEPAALINADLLPQGFGPVEPLTEPLTEPLAKGGMAALVSECDCPSFDELGRSELAGRLVALQRVIEVALERVSLVPVRVGTVLRSRAEVIELITMSSDVLADVWSRVDGRIEVEISASWDTSEVFAEIGCAPEILAAKEVAATAEPVTAGQAIPKSITDIALSVKAALEAKRERFVSDLLNVLGPVAVDSHVNDVILDDQAASVSLLVHRDELAALDDALAGFDCDTDGRFTFRRIAPLAPHSFVSTTVRRLEPERLAFAKRVLDLPEDEPVTEEVVTTSFRAVARSVHPDHNGGDPLATHRFRMLSDARRDLLACVKAARSGANHDGSTVVLMMERSGREVMS